MGNKFYKVEYDTANAYHISKLQSLIDNLPSAQSTTQDKLNQNIEEIDQLIRTPQMRKVDHFANLNISQNDAAILINKLLEHGIIESAFVPKFRVLNEYNSTDLKAKLVDTLPYTTPEEIDLKEKLKREPGIN